MNLWLYAGKGADFVISDLNTAITKKQEFIRQKNTRMAVFRKMATEAFTPQQRYDYNKRMYTEYRKFKLDSAIFFVKENLKITSELKNAILEDESNLQLANLFSTSGRYRESEAILKSIDKKHLDKRLLPAYYESYSQFFEHYATNSYQADYVKNIEIYRDSLLAVLHVSSIKYKINIAQKDLYNGRIKVARNNLLQLLDAVKAENADYAMISYLLGYTYGLDRNIELQKKYYILSAIADIKNAIMDNAAMQSLALIFYETGNIDQAYKCTRSAIDDAIFCNVKFRTLEMSELYSIINSAYLDREAQRKSQLQFYLALISILTLFLIATVFYIYKQMRKVSRVREELHKTGEKLKRLNSDISNTNVQLHERNGQLLEANHIKEEYIAHFFDLCSAYINKLENYRKTLNKKATDKQLEELFKMLKSNTIVENELEELYKNFDTIFLNLYPGFVKDFNDLLIADEQVQLKHDEILNTELRIFALIRLGITDSVKIAAFLRYSLSTIYNYRTKARNKAVVSRDEFEKLVSKIGNIPGNQS